MFDFPFNSKNNIKRWEISQHNRWHTLDFDTFDVRIIDI